MRELPGREQQLAAQLEACRKELAATQLQVNELLYDREMDTWTIRQQCDRIAELEVILRRKLYPAHLFGEVVP